MVTGGACDADQASLAICGRPGSVGGFPRQQLWWKFIDVDDGTVDASLRATHPTG